MLKQIFKLISSSILGQMISLLSLLVVARIVTPIEYGVYTLCLTLAKYITVVSTAKYQHAIFVINKKDANLLTNGATFLCSALAVVSVFIVFLIKHNMGVWNDVSYLNVSLTGLAGYLSATNLFYYYLAVTEDRINRVVKSRVIAPLIGGVGTVVLALYYKNSTALLVGYIITLSLTNGYISPKLKLNIDINKLLDVLKKSRKYPATLLPAGFLETFNSSYLLLATSSLFNVEVVAFLGMYFKLVASPQGMISTAVSDIYRKKLSGFGKSQHIEQKKFFIRSVFIMFIVSLFATISLYLCIGFLLVPLLGDEWKGAQDVFFALIPMFFVSFIVSPFSSTLYVKDGLKLDLFLQLFLSISLCIHYKYYGGYVFLDYISFYGFIIISKYFIELLLCYKCISKVSNYSE